VKTDFPLQQSINWRRIESMRLGKCRKVH